VASIMTAEAAGVWRLLVCKTLS